MSEQNKEIRSVYVVGETVMGLDGCCDEECEVDFEKLRRSLGSDVPIELL